LVLEDLEDLRELALGDLEGLGPEPENFLKVEPVLLGLLLWSSHSLRNAVSNFSYLEKHDLI